jgi:hypothetical protein
MFGIDPVKAGKEAEAEFDPTHARWQSPLSRLTNICLTIA